MSHSGARAAGPVSGQSPCGAGCVRRRSAIVAVNARSASPLREGRCGRARGPPPLGASGLSPGRRLGASTATGACCGPSPPPDGFWRLPAAAADVDPRFLAMLIAYEDKRFYSIPASISLRLLRAGLAGLAHGRVVSGGSTLTMQVARLLEPRPERTLAAKVRRDRARGAARAPAEQGRDPALYLALAPYGGNLEGMRAASLAYFGKEPKRLSTAEAALLVALPQAPEARRPDRDPAGGPRAPATACSPALVAPASSARDQAERPRSSDVPPAARGVPGARRRTSPSALARRARTAPGRAHDDRAPPAGARSRRWRASARDGSAAASPSRSSPSTTPPARSAPMSAAPAIFDRDRAGAGRHGAGAALAGLGAEALHLRARLRGRRWPIPETLVDDRPDALRRLPAREFRPRASRAP